MLFTGQREKLFSEITQVLQTEEHLREALKNNGIPRSVYRHAQTELISICRDTNIRLDIVKIPYIAEEPSGIHKVMSANALKFFSKNGFNTATLFFNEAIKSMDVRIFENDNAIFDAFTKDKILTELNQNWDRWYDAYMHNRTAWLNDITNTTTQEVAVL